MDLGKKKALNHTEKVKAEELSQTQPLFSDRGRINTKKQIH